MKTMLMPQNSPQFTLQECEHFIDVLTKEANRVFENSDLYHSDFDEEEALKDIFYRHWRSRFLQYYYKAGNGNDHDKQFIKHCIEFIGSLNQSTQNQSCLLEKILTQNGNLFFLVVRKILDGDYFAIFQPELRAFFEAGVPRIHFSILWDLYQDSKYRKKLRLNSKGRRLYFTETGDWIYHQENLELVFKPLKISSRPGYYPGRNLQNSNFISFPSSPFDPWLWLLSWQRENIGPKATSRHIDKMIGFLEPLHEAEILSKPGRMLYYFVLSELHLHPKRTDGPDLKTAQKLVDEIAAEHPLELFDPKLPARVLAHCAEMRLKNYQTLLVTPSSGSAWQPEFLLALSKILPALHALLCWRRHPETARASENHFDSESEINSMNEEYLKVLLQKLNPAIFSEQKAEKLPKKDSFQGQVYFTVLPRLIEYFMRADKILKDQMVSLAAQIQAAANIMLKTMWETLKRYRLELAELFCNEIRNLLSLKPADTRISPQDHETSIREKILAHALNWPAAILQQEENRLTQRMTANPEKALQPPEPPQIAVLQEGRQQITQLTRRCLSEDIRPAEYTRQVQMVLDLVEQKGGAHNSFLTVVARVAANLVIFLSAGLLHSFFKKQIQETRAAPVTGFGQYFFSVKSRRAETIHYANTAVDYGNQKLIC